jgi:hypothetical protein
VNWFSLLYIYFGATSANRRSMDGTVKDLSERLAVKIR